MTPEGTINELGVSTQDGDQPKTQRTVFDLDTFSNVLLVKTFNPPAKPTSIEEALAAVGNNNEKLLSVIYDGLLAEARKVAYESNDGWNLTDDEGDPAGVYNGKFASEKLGKLINGAVITMAKLSGYEKSLSPEKKKELKRQAMDFIRSNPAVLENIKNQAAS